MMVSPAWYYEEKLKGKTAQQIKKEIRSLKQQIGRLKKMVENPQGYLDAWMICPDPEVQLQMCRLYLRKAEESLGEAVDI